MAQVSSGATSTKVDKIFQYFAGQYCQFVLRSLKGEQQLDDGTTLVGNLLVEGYLLDEDDKFYYIGDHIETVTECLEKAEIIRIYNDVDAETENAFGGSFEFDDEEFH